MAKHRNKPRNRKSTPRPTATPAPTPPPRAGWLRTNVALVALVFTATSATAAVLTFYFNIWRQADLTVVVRPTKIEQLPDATQRTTLEVAVENRGRKAAPQFFWFLIVPEQDVVSAALQFGANQLVPKKVLLKDGRKALQFEGQVKEPVNQGAMIFSTLTLEQRTTQAADLRWQLQCCDTKLFPEEAPASDKFGRITLTPVLMRRWEPIYSTPLQ